MSLRGKAKFMLGQDLHASLRSCSSSERSASSRNDFRSMSGSSNRDSGASEESMPESKRSSKRQLDGACKSAPPAKVAKRARKLPPGERRAQAETIPRRPVPTEGHSEAAKQSTRHQAATPVQMREGRKRKDYSKASDLRFETKSIPSVATTAKEGPPVAPPKDSLQMGMWRGRKIVAEKLYESSSDEESECETSCANLSDTSKFDKSLKDADSPNNEDDTFDMDRKQGSKRSHPAPRDATPVIPASVDKTPEKSADYYEESIQLLYGDLEGNANSTKDVAAATLPLPATSTSLLSKGAFSSRPNKATEPTLDASPETHPPDGATGRIQTDEKDEEETYIAALPSSIASRDPVKESERERGDEQDAPPCQGDDLQDATPCQGGDMQDATLCVASSAQTNTNGNSSHSKMGLINGTPSSTSKSTNGSPDNDQKLPTAPDIQLIQDPSDLSATSPKTDLAAKRSSWAVYPGLVFAFVAGMYLSYMPDGHASLSYLITETGESALRVSNQIFQAAFMALAGAVIVLYYPFQLIRNGQFLDFCAFMFITMLFMGSIYAGRARHGN